MKAKNVSDNPNGAPWAELVVGLGASAGGLEALTAFFEAVPCDTGCAFVVIQHLSPEHKSVMDELLGRRTQMDVAVVTDRTKVRANTVYLMPRRKNMELVDGHLVLSEPVDRASLNLPIDLFFDSLAQDAGARAVAIILSGTGSDGSRGIRRIKETGGLVLVQDPDTAQFDGMPRSAMFTELVDFSLSPADLAKHVDEYVRHPTVREPGQSDPVELGDNSETLDDIFRPLLEHTGIDFSHYKPATVARRLERRISINRLHSIEEYRDLLSTSPREIQILGRELLINVTHFFRDGNAFEFLYENVIRDAVDNLPDQQEFRVWVAGCSTGEEAYSIAILVDDAFRAANKPRRAKIFATDVDATALSEASPGHFTSAIEKHVSKERLKRHFDALEDGYVLRQGIRQMVVFARHNMITDPPFPSMDLVCCRNVLIYFQHATQQGVLSKFNFSLKEGGHAFFGAVESIGELDQSFDCIDGEFRIYKKSAQILSQLTSAKNLQRSPSHGTVNPIEGLLKKYRAGSRDRGLDQIRDTLLSEYLPATIVLDEKYQAVHVYGDAGDYLTRFPAGRVTNRIEDILPRELSTCITVGLDKVRKSHALVTFDAVPITLNEERVLTDVHIRRFQSASEDSAILFLVILQPPRSGTSNPEEFATSLPPDSVASRRIQELEEQLDAEQRHRRTTAEQLESTNEELQSANEELVASNEELQSTNEELQSVNEELFTVNSEFQEKILELSLINDDVDKIMELTHIGLVFLDREQRVRKFSKAATRYFRLLPSDIGRPLQYVANEFEHETLSDEIDKVVGGAPSNILQLTTYEGVSVDVRILSNSTDPSNSEDNFNGVIVIATDNPGMPPGELDSILVPT